MFWLQDNLVLCEATAEAYLPEGCRAFGPQQGAQQFAAMQQFNVSMSPTDSSSSNVLTLAALALAVSSMELLSGYQTMRTQVHIREDETAAMTTRHEVNACIRSTAAATI